MIIEEIVIPWIKNLNDARRSFVAIESGFNTMVEDWGRKTIQADVAAIIAGYGVPMISEGTPTARWQREINKGIYFLGEIVAVFKGIIDKQNGENKV